MIIEEYKIGNTTIQIDDTYFPKTEEEKQKRYEDFNSIGCKILESIKKEE